MALKKTSHKKKNATPAESDTQISLNSPGEKLTESREKFMTLGEHLEELRQRLLRGILVIILLMSFGLYFGPEIHRIFTAPYKAVLGENAVFFQLKLMAPFIIYLKTSFMLSILLGFPFILYLLWGFIAPALETRTERYGIFLILFSTILFWAGITLCWLTVFENMLRIFLVMFRPPDIETKLPIEEYYDLFFNIHLVFGLAFQMPVVFIIAGRIGIISSGFLISKWRETVIIISVLSAVLSPGPDVFSMMMLFLPLLILFFISLVLMKILEKRDSETQLA